MSRFLLLLALALVPCAAHADTVHITFVQDMITPSQARAVVATGVFPFTGTQKIVFKIAGKTCTFVGSAKAPGPRGCNYWLTLDVASGLLFEPRAENNPGCTAPQDMLESCK